MASRIHALLILGRERIATVVHENSCPPVAHDSQSVCAVECLVDEQNNINDWARVSLQNRVWGISIQL